MTTNQEGPAGDLVIVLRISRSCLVRICGALAIVVGVVALPAMVRAMPSITYPLSLPHTFSNGAIADATEVNDNFAALRDAINDLDSRVSALTNRVPSDDRSRSSDCRAAWASPNCTPPRGSIPRSLRSGS